VARELADEKAHLVITDPEALENARIDLRDLDQHIEYVEDPYEAAKKSHAIAVITEWNLYRHLDYERIHKSMVKPAFIFDGRNLLDHRRLFEMGFNMFPIGKPPLTHF
jgi:UDPglucose 6-dehydrogenase